MARFKRDTTDLPKETVQIDVDFQMPFSSALAVTFATAMLTPLIANMAENSKFRSESLHRMNQANAHLDTASLAVLTESIKSLLNPAPRAIRVSTQTQQLQAEPLAVT
jgi:hypothetical protein